MRFKKYSKTRKILIGKKIKKICKKNNVKFLVNDDPMLSKKIDADGCHLGQKDMNIDEARKIIGNQIIGVTCHNSLNLAKKAIKGKASYLALGAFYSSKTKKTKYVASVNILKRVKKFTKTPTVAIGGINDIKNVEATQTTFNHRAKMCTLAAQGKWSSELENK